jgi:hypothetical protein
VPHSLPRLRPLSIDGFGATVLTERYPLTNHSRVPRWIGVRDSCIPAHLVSVLVNPSHSLPTSWILLKSHLIIFQSELKIAQRFNAGRHALSLLSPIGTAESFFRPSRGLHLHVITKPSPENFRGWVIVKLVPPLPRRIFHL